MTASVLGMSPAFAAELLWSAPEGCAHVQFIKELEGNTGQAVSDLPASFLEVEVQRYAPTTWVATFALRSSLGDTSPKRRIEGDSCSDVSKAVAVAVALALHRSTGQDSEASTVADPPPLVASPATPLAPAPPRHAGPAPRLGARGALLLDGALLGQTALGLQVGTFLGVESFETGLSASLLMPTEVRTSDTLGVQLQGYFAELDACFTLAHTGVQPQACLGYQLGVVRGEGVGSELEVRRSQVAVWHAVHPSLSISLPLMETVDLRVSAGAVLGFVRARFLFDENRIVHELPAISGRGALGLVWTP